jgi:hypothetical protein
MRMTPEELASRKEEFAALRRERERIKEAHPQAHRWLRDLFARHDPLGWIAVGAPNDEYEEQADMVLPRLLELRTTGSLAGAEVLRIVHEEFVKWFGAGTAGLAERYASIAAEVFEGLERELPAAEIDDSPAPQVD